jgi:hypothetical protein
VSSLLTHSALPAIQWAKGHDKNRHINKADQRATAAAAAQGPPCALEAFLALHPTTPVIFHKQTGLIQLGPPFDFVRSTLRFTRDNVLYKRILEVSPREVTDRKLLRRLQSLPGACDLLQGYARRSIGPAGCKERCPVPSCTAMQTAAHVLTCMDADHLTHIAAMTPYGSDPGLGDNRSVADILCAFAVRKHEAMAFVCARTISFITDRNARIWAQWLLRRLLMMHAFRDRPPLDLDMSALPSNITH